MPNFLENLRMRNIFPPGTGSELQAPESLFPSGPSPLQNVNFGPQTDFTRIPTMAQPPEFDVSQRMREIYSPETIATDRFNRLIDEQPQFEKPGFWRTIASALSAFGPGGHETGMQVAMEPYTRKMESWKSTIGPAQAAANLERQQNVNERTMAYQTIMQELKQRADEARALGDERSANIAQQRIDKMMSDLDRMNLGQKQALERISATGEQRRGIEELKSEQRLQLEREKAERAQQQKVNLQNIKNKTAETLGALDELLSPEGKLKPEIKSAVGRSRMFGLQYLPATETRAGDAAIKRLKSMLVVELIGDMKAQSRTGATGFGQLNLRELDVLERAASKLDPALDETTFENELNRIREKLSKVLKPGNGLEPTTVPKKPTAAELIKKYSGG